LSADGGGEVRRKEEGRQEGGRSKGERGSGRAEASAKERQTCDDKVPCLERLASHCEMICTPGQTLDWPAVLRHGSDSRRERESKGGGGRGRRVSREGPGGLMEYDARVLGGAKAGCACVGWRRLMLARRPPPVTPFLASASSLSLPLSPSCNLDTQTLRPKRLEHR
jgi:hypothetical protein